MAIRHLVESDLTQVVDLYWNHMRGRRGPAPQELQPCFRDLYFSNPWANRATPSFVYEDRAGRILGFLGVTGRRITVNGHPIRAAYGGNFVVHPQARSGIAAARLLQALVSSEYDLVLTDSANEKTRDILERLHWSTIPALNFHWARPLRPTQYATLAISKALPSLFAPVFLGVAKPFGLLADASVCRLEGPFRQDQSRLKGFELDVETLAQCQAAVRQSYRLWPEYDCRSLKWLLGFMESRRKRGRLRKIAVRDQNQKTVGWYIYYVKRGAVGEVVQVGGEPKFFREILRHLFHDGWEQGVVAMHGVAQFRQLPAYSDEGCFFTCRGGWILAHARDPEILEILDRGDGWLSRLDGEWCLDPG